MCLRGLFVLVIIVIVTLHDLDPFETWLGIVFFIIVAVRATMGDAATGMAQAFTVIFWGQFGRIGSVINQIIGNALQL